MSDGTTGSWSAIGRDAGKNKILCFWRQQKDALRIVHTLLYKSPVVRTYTLKDLPHNVHCFGGISALAYYSMLADDRYPTYALSREEYRQLQLSTYEICPKTEIPACRLQILRYKIEQNHVIDPLSAILCIADQDKEDPRIGSAVEMISEEVWNG